MVAIQKNYSAAFKLKAVIESLKGKKTLPQLAAELGVSSDLLQEWKRYFVANGAQIFQTSRPTDNISRKPEKIELFRPTTAVKSPKVLLKKKVI